MQRQILKKPTLVLMAGLPGVGKTTLATQLAQELQWTVIQRDTIKEALLRTVDEDTAGRLAYDAFLELAEEWLVKMHMSVILDSSALHPFVRKKAQELALKAGANFKIILCHVDEDMRRQRLLLRELRNSQSRSVLRGLGDFQQFNELPKEHTISISTEIMLENYIDKAITYVTTQEGLLLTQ